MRHCFQRVYALIGDEKANDVGGELERQHRGCDFMEHMGGLGVLCCGNAMYVTRKSILMWHP
jgi:hypothetical protein